MLIFSARCTCTRSSAQKVLAFSAGLGLLVDRAERLEAQLATQLRRGCVHFDIDNTTAKPVCNRM